MKKKDILKILFICSIKKLIYLKKNKIPTLNIIDIAKRRIFIFLFLLFFSILILIK